MNRDNLLLSTHNKPNHDISACMPARTYSSSFLLAQQAVSHPSIHVTERWVHPVTGQLVAVTLIYVAPLSSLFLLWWRDCIYVCMHARSLLGRFTRLVMGAGVGAQSDRSGREELLHEQTAWWFPAWASFKGFKSQRGRTQLRLCRSDSHCSKWAQLARWRRS